MRGEIITAVRASPATKPTRTRAHGALSDAGRRASARSTWSGQTQEEPIVRTAETVASSSRAAACWAPPAWRRSSSRLGMVTAYAQSASDYKALVCIFLFGGNDSNNMIVPIDIAVRRLPAPCAARWRSVRRRCCRPDRQRLRLPPVAGQRAAALQPEPRRDGVQRRHAGPADDQGHAATAPRCRATCIRTPTRRSSGRAPTRTAAAPAGAGASTTSRMAHEHRRAAARHHRERRQRAVPVRSGDQGMNFSNARFVRLQRVRRRHRDERRASARCSGC